MKKLMEQRAAKHKAMTDLLNKAKTENRAFTPEEQTQFDTLENEINALDTTIAAEQRAHKFNMTGGAPTTETQEQREERAFVAHIFDMVENRAENLGQGSNGAVVGVTIVNRIIRRVKEISPILKRAQVYHVKGTLKVPVYGDNDEGGNIAVGYQKEFTEMAADAGKFVTVELNGYLIGALALIGRNLKNNATFDVVTFIVEEMARRIAEFLEGELLNGTGTNAIQGVIPGCTNIHTAKAAEVAADDLITLQGKVKTAFQREACWIMHPDTFTEVRKLKDGNNRYLLQDNIAGEFPYILLGKPVFLSDNMPRTASGAKPVVYGDMQGLAVNIQDVLEIQVLREKFATMNAIGVVSWLTADAKVADQQRIAVLELP